MKHLIVTGDDFGVSHRVNAEIERLHRAGLLTQASLMVNGGAVEEAVRVAARNPGLTVGLHLALCDARGSVLSAITDPAGNLPASPAAAGLRYAFDPRLRRALEEEIHLQVDGFRALGFAPAYWDGHTHLHLHPIVLRLSLPRVSAGGFRFTRLVREPKSRRFLPMIFHTLSAAAAPKLRRLGIGFADHVYGLSETGAMNMAAFTRILAGVGEGWNEVYLHPGVDGVDLDPARLLEEIHEAGITLGDSGAFTRAHP